MALLFCDGFDSYSVEADALSPAGVTGWSSVQDFAGLVTGRNSYGKAVNMTSSADWAILSIEENPATIIFGVAWRSTDTSYSATPYIIKLYDSASGSGSPHLELRPAADTMFDLLVNGSSVATDIGSFSLNVWTYLEIKLTVNNTTGAYEVRQDGIAIASGSSTDTQNGSNAYTDRIILIGGAGGSSRYDDLYVCDDSGTDNNNFLGDVRIQTLLPNADGVTTDFTPLSGANYTNVDETSPDNDTSYNSGSSVADKDLYNHGSLTGTIGTILGVMQVASVKKTDATTRTIDFKMDDSVNAEASDNGAHDVPSDYRRLHSIWENDTAGTAWTETKVNAIEAGIEIDS